MQKVEGRLYDQGLFRTPNFGAIQHSDNPRSGRLSLDLSLVFLKPSCMCSPVRPKAGGPDRGHELRSPRCNFTLPAPTPAAFCKNEGHSEQGAADAVNKD
jgi:hypothetical protein